MASRSSCSGLAPTGNHSDSRKSLTRPRYNSELNEQRAWSLGQRITTPIPLREAMTLFWHGHFASAAGQVNISQANSQQHETLQRLAPANFRDLLSAVTLDAAMRIYLDLEGCDKLNPNENDARELFEPFMVGIGLYSDPDIKATAPTSPRSTIRAT